METQLTPCSTHASSIIVSRNIKSFLNKTAKVFSFDYLTFLVNFMILEAEIILVKTVICIVNNSYYLNQVI